MPSANVGNLSSSTDMEDIGIVISGDYTLDQARVLLDDTSEPLRVVAALERAKLFVIQNLGTIGV